MSKSIEENVESTEEKEYIQKPFHMICFSSSVTDGKGRHHVTRGWRMN